MISAINAGYRHFDCAWMYGNEKEVGNAIQEKIEDSTVERKDLFVCSKVMCISHDFLSSTPYLDDN